VPKEQNVNVALQTSFELKSEAEELMSLVTKMQSKISNLYDLLEEEEGQHQIQRPR
jgi:hypothetical protein